MNCQQSRTLLDRLLDGELEAHAASKLRAHLRSCPACATELADRESLRPLVRQALQGQPAPADLADKLRQRLHQTSTTRQPAWRHALAAGVLAIGIGLGWILHAVLLPTVTTTTAHNAEKYVYHINSSEHADVVLQNIRFHLEARPEAKFIVVTHNEGVDFLLQGAIDRKGTPFSARVAELAGRGVQFRVCNNTLKARHIAPVRVIAQAQLVPSGIAEVGRLQSQEGYAYLKP